MTEGVNKRIDNDTNETIGLVYQKIQDDQLVLDQYVDNFYRMKNDYESRRTNLITRKKDELKSKGASGATIRKKLAAMRFPCANCSRKVDSIFSTSGGKLIAKCGSIESPCNLNIVINKGTYFPHERLMNGTVGISGLLRDIEKAKRYIIRMKLDMVFEFSNVRDTLRNFTRVKDELSNLYAIYEERFAVYIMTVDKYDYTQLAAMELKRDGIINSIKRMIIEYDGNSDEVKRTLKRDNVFATIADKYINELGDIVRDINTFKYNVYAVESSNKGNEHTFVKKEYSYVDTIQQNEDFSVESNVHRE